jgi:flagellar hook assembly protein FlgD/outer membrane protein OmpA-like peptidoglycan-associated protein
MFRNKIDILFLSILLMFLSISFAFSEAFPGADAVPDLYTPALNGAGAFSTSQGGAPVSAVNPAQGGAAQLMVFDLGYLALPGFGSESGLGHDIGLGALIPTKYAVFGGSLRLLLSPFDAFPIKNTFGGNVNVSKELYPGMNVGAGLNFGFGDEWTLSGDLGFRYNMGKIAFMDDFTWAVVLRNLGKSWTPTAFTPIGGVSFDFLRVDGAENKPDPLRLGLSADLGLPGFTNFTGKIGLNAVIAELVNISLSTGFNVEEITAKKSASMIPSVGITFHLATKKNTDYSPAGVLNRDGNMAISASARPLYDDIWAMGAGFSWTVGIPDRTAPAITVDYADTQWISPNNDGKSDVLEFPITITDQRYVAEWTLDIQDEAGNVVRTYRNKELRPETQGFRNVFDQLIAVKTQVEIPENLRWDGNLETGGMAPDGNYFFTLSAVDDNGNKSSYPLKEVIIDNTHPSVEITALTEAERIFSPDGDGNKDVFSIEQSSSAEDLWDAGFYNAEGIKVKSFDFANAEAQNITWDGTDDGGLIVPDGIYTYKISSIDKAMNDEYTDVANIIVNTIQPSLSLTIEDAYFSPNNNGVKDNMILHTDVPITDGITQWKAEIKDTDGIVRRTYNGNFQVPSEIIFDGNDAAGKRLTESSYQATLVVSYRNGYVSSASSPVFTLDVTAPSGNVRTEYNAFSPNNDGKQDEMIFVQNASQEVLWTGEIRSQNNVNAVVKTFRFSGIPPAKLSWDGRNDEGGLSEDGNYRYQFISTDQSGNRGSSIPVSFNLSTADTPLILTTDKLEFSPNADRIEDVIVFMPLLQVREGIAAYQLEILDSQNIPMRTFEGGSTVPNVFVWDGKNDTGAPVSDAAYMGRMIVTYTAGNQPSANSQIVTLDTTSPYAELSAPYTLFSPNGDGQRDEQPFNISTIGNDEWEARILDSRENMIQSWEWTGSAPSIQWDGKDKAGNPMPDASYGFVLRSTDDAGNSYTETIQNIVLDVRAPRAFLTASNSSFAPKNGGNESIRFAIILNPDDGISEWNFDIKDEKGNVIRQFLASNEASDIIPESIEWDGRNEAGTINEGKYTAQLSVHYEKGDSVNVSAGPVTLDISGPALSFTTSPEYFSPDNDGAEDDLFISLSAKDASPIDSWTFEIREPQPPFNLFYKIEGKGMPSERLVWDGRSSTGELVQAATDYPAKFTAVDNLGNVNSTERMVGVDVLVLRDGDMLRIQVPSIIFRENAADFNNIPKENLDNNIRVLRRIAEILNKFRGYKVQVEGHANPVTRTIDEETKELQPLSEDRAHAVMDMLVEYGVDRNRLTSVGMGGSRPVIQWEDHDNWWKNRRVEFILIK